jgi:hypothetical protein
MESTVSLAKLALPAQIRRRYDPDAAAYIANVEAADGQSLEQLVKEAITGFVIDCKTTGIWSAIQSCCLLCGARTLNGALVPLKGSAPTNFNSLFNNNDYSRDIGLKGNGSSKYLNTNFLATSLDQNNFHFSMYISTLSSVGTQKTYMADGGRNMYRPITNNTSTQFNINASFGASGGDLNMASSIGFCGLSRDNASNFTINVGSRNRTYVANSIIDSGTLGGTMRIFGRNGNGVMGEFSDGRISFYSIGNSIDLKNLNNCIQKYMSSIFFLTSSSIVVAFSSTGDIIQPTTYSLSGTNYTAYSFTDQFGELRVVQPREFDYLVVAGGGAGGGWYAGGGGGGGVLQGSIFLNRGSYPVTVGRGGTKVTSGTGGNGGNSIIHTLLAIGGGGGGRYTERGRDGGSGGGSSSAAPGGGFGALGQADQGNRGANWSSPNLGAGGGGGAGGPGLDISTGSNLCIGLGGSGIYSDISGTSVLYSTGGIGSCFAANATNIGGGGDGSFTNAAPGGGNGANGIIILRHSS